MEITYFNQQQDVRVKVTLRKFELLLILVIIITVLLSLFGGRIDERNWALLLSLLRTVTAVGGGA